MTMQAGTPTRPRTLFTSQDEAMSVSEAIERFATETRGMEAPRLRGIKVEGTVVRYVHHRTRHVYLTLADGASSLEIFVHRGDTWRLPADLATGCRVRITGKLSLYGPARVLQCHTSAVMVLEEAAAERRASSLQALQAPEATWGDSETAEGAIDTATIATRRRPIPDRPERVGIVTAPGGAALKDVLGVFKRRAPWIQVLFAPAQIQGKGAPESIATAMRKLAITGCDLILLTRGGAGDGFAPFDDARVVSTIAACPLPVATAIGHAGDQTLACKTADIAFDTPTAAAYELTHGHARLLPDAHAMDRALEAFGARMEENLEQLRLDLEPLEGAISRLIEQAGSVSVEVLV